ncbi:MAG: VCBS repeat-containing protein, partial [Kangiellaceae bacterium]|nr:VCBS repeat-containing protein [Kangiellaceae bacterium]
DSDSDSDSDSDQSDTGLVFENITVAAIDTSPELNTHFWAGAPDVNNDGCIDLYVAEHRDGGHDENNVPTDDINSSMFLHDVIDGRCANSWTHYADVENYSQSSPQTPRITANNMWGNFTGNTNGYWSFGGIDADGSDPAFYEIDNVNSQGEPIYKAKRGSNCGSRHLCMYGDFSGDGDIDILRADRESEEPTLVVDDETGAVLIEVDVDVAAKELDAVNLMFDVDGDGWPDIYVVKDGGYWRNNEGLSFTWIASLHPSFGNPSGTTTERRTLNHQVVLDFDNDGDQDLIGSAGQNEVDGVFCFKLYRNNNTNSWDDVTATSGLDGCPVNSESFWTIPYSNSTIGDLNLDGFMDVVMFGETYGNTATLLINNGDGSFTIDRGIDFGVAYNSLGAGKSHGQVRDVDGDGLPDIIKTQDQSGADHHAIAVWKNKTVTSNRWLTVRARGLGENSDGIHTYLTVYKPNTTTVVTSFEINTRFGNEYLIPTLGMAENDTVDVKVSYPHGGPEYLIEDLSTNQSIIIFYDGCVDEGVQGGSRLPVNSSEATCDRNLDP